MAMVKRDQLIYSGRGPLDAKSLVKTYKELTDIATWTQEVDGTEIFGAYNGMMVAVWLNKEDTSKNGLYFLFDSQVTSALKQPDVTNEANWHRINKGESTNELISRITSVETDLIALRETVQELETVQSESFSKREIFPETGIVNKIYIALDEKKSYTWDPSIGYVCISSNLSDINTICGGSASYVVD